ncbi:MAG: hypothetical protein IJU66_09690, partial [Oscillospiraceae bacterium]|nr:hypothetical protein [Oscillospiraceae bacterium]
AANPDIIRITDKNTSIASLWGWVFVFNNQMPQIASAGTCRAFFCRGAAYLFSSRDERFFHAA